MLQKIIDNKKSENVEQRFMIALKCLFFIQVIYYIQNNISERQRYPSMLQEMVLPSELDRYQIVQA